MPKQYIDELKSNLLQKLNFKEWNNLQKEYWQEHAAFKKLLANTGSGKTLAYLIELVKNLEQNNWNEKAIVILPTRELAIQVFEVLKQFNVVYKTTLCYGGHKFEIELEQLKEKPSIVVGTPGRILDHLERKSVGFPEFKHLVIDEYDKLLDLGFLEELNHIVNHSDGLNSVQLVSATEIDNIPNLFESYIFKINDFRVQKNHLFYGKIIADQQDKMKALAQFLSNTGAGTKIIFCSHREATERVSEQLFEYGIPNVFFHGGLEQIERERAIQKFKLGAFDCLVATDIASRGIDIEGVKMVIHYQFPNHKEEFIHRNGRTGRMNADGEVYIVLSEDEEILAYMHDFSWETIQSKAEFGEYESSDKIVLYLNAGRKQKIRKMDVVGVLTKEFEIDFASLGGISIQDNYTYFALNKKVYFNLKNQLSKISIKKKKYLISPCR